MQLQKPFITAFVLLATLAIIFFLVLPVYNKFRVHSADLVRAQKEYQYLEDDYKNFEELDTKLSQNADALAKLDAALPTNPLVPELLAYLQQAASQNGLILSSVSVSDPKETVQPGITYTAVKITASGSYESLKTFLSSVYKNSRMIDVDSISFSAPKPGLELFNFNIILRAYNLASVSTASSSAK